MHKATTIPPHWSVAWHEGLPLQAQHMQQDARFWEARIQAQQTTHAHAWGWRHWQTHTAAGDPYFRLMHCNGIGPEGHWWCHQHSSQTSLSILMEQEGLIYVQWDPSPTLANLAHYPKHAKDQAHWLAQYASTMDVYDSNRCAEVCYALPQLRLAYEKNEKTMNMPIASIIQSQGTWVADPHYLPPSPRLPRDHPLFLSLQQGHQARQAHLPSAHEPIQAHHPALLKLHAETALLLQQKEAHPYDFYQSLYHALSTLQALNHHQGHTNALPDYNHLQISQSLQSISEALLSELKNVQANEKRSVPLQRISQNRLRFSVPYMMHSNRWTLQIKHPKPYPGWKQNREKHIKINQAEAIERNLMHATSGLKIIPIYSEQETLWQCEIKVNEHESEQNASSTFMIFLPDDLTTCLIELYTEKDHDA